MNNNENISTSPYEITNWLHIFLMALTFFICLLLLWKDNKIKNLRLRYFAWEFSTLTQKFYFELTKDLRHDLFNGIKNIKSSDPNLQKNDVIRILEIGVGSGANFIFYPPNSRLIVIEPNPYFESYFNINKEKFPNIILEKSINGVGENMNEIQTESIDVVVITSALCAVDDIQQVLKEIKRVLVPGGKFFYLEHVAGESNTLRYKIQRLANIIFWRFSNLCSLDRSTGVEIINSGFSTVEQKYIFLKPKRTYLFARHVVGVATK